MFIKKSFKKNKLDSLDIMALIYTFEDCYKKKIQIMKKFFFHIFLDLLKRNGKKKLF